MRFNCTIKEKKKYSSWKEKKKTDRGFGYEFMKSGTVAETKKKKELRNSFLSKFFFLV